MLPVQAVKKKHLVCFENLQQCRPKLSVKRRVLMSNRPAVLERPTGHALDDSQRQISAVQTPEDDGRVLPKTQTERRFATFI
jgi:hypothetical protein